MADMTPDLFAGLTAEAVAEVTRIATPLHLPPDAVLFPLGGPAEHLYLIVRGRVSLTLPIHIGGRDENVLVEERGPGETIGWSALFPPYRFTLEARTLLDVDVLAFSQVALIEYLSEHPAIGHRVMRNIASIIGQRLQVFQTMWLRAMQRSLRLHVGLPEGVVS